MTTISQYLDRQAKEPGPLAPARRPSGSREAPNATVRHASPLESEIVTSRGGFLDLEADWNSLTERAAGASQPFRSFAWHLHWLDHYHPADATTTRSQHLNILVTRRNNEIVTIWPLMAERSLACRMLTWMGEPVSQYGDVIVRDGPDTQEILEAGWAHLRSNCRFDLVRLRKVRADSAIAPILGQAAFQITLTEEAPYIDLQAHDPVAAHHARLSRHTVRNRRRLERRLRERGPVSIETHPAGDLAGRIAHDIVEAKRAQLVARGEFTRAYGDARMAQFFADVCSVNGRSCGGWVSTLKCGDDIAAAMIGIVEGDALYLHVLMYDEAYSNCGPGLIHMLESVKTLAKEGFARFDLLAPRHDYKMEWADGVVEVRDYCLSTGIIGRLHVDIYQRRLRNRMKRLWPRLPGIVRRGVSWLVRRAHGAG